MQRDNPIGRSTTVSVTAESVIMPRKLNTGALCAFAIGGVWILGVAQGTASLTFDVFALFAAATMIWLGLESLKKYGILLPPKKR